MSGLSERLLAVETKKRAGNRVAKCYESAGPEPEHWHRPSKTTSINGWYHYEFDDGKKLTTHGPAVVPIADTSFLRSPNWFPWSASWLDWLRRRDAAAAKILNAESPDAIRPWPATPWSFSVCAQRDYVDQQNEMLERNPKAQREAAQIAASRTGATHRACRRFGQRHGLDLDVVIRKRKESLT